MLNMLNVIWPMDRRGVKKEIIFVYVEVFSRKIRFWGHVELFLQRAPQFVYVAFFWLKGGQLPNNVLLSAEMLKMLYQIECHAPKKKRFFLLKC